MPHRKKLRNCLLLTEVKLQFVSFVLANELGIRTVAIYAEEDKLALHRFKADEAYQVGKNDGPRKGISEYQ